MLECCRRSLLRSQLRLVAQLHFHFHIPPSLLRIIIGFPFLFFPSPFLGLFTATSHVYNLSPIPDIDPYTSNPEDTAVIELRQLQRAGYLISSHSHRYSALALLRTMRVTLMLRRERPPLGRGPQEHLRYLHPISAIWARQERF